jgi:hypothetical protein
MKILSTVKSLGLVMLMLAITVSGLSLSNLAPEKNQLTAFPNTNQAPTMAQQIPLANYTAPLLSRALLETDPTRKLKKAEFIETIKYSSYDLTRG